MRPDPIARALLAFGAVVVAGFGAAFTLFPTSMAAFVEIGAVSPSARADFAATYGGLELGLAAFLALCLRRGAVRLGLEAALLAFAGLGAVRLAYLLMGGGSGLVWALLAAEAAAVALALWGLRRLSG